MSETIDFSYDKLGTLVESDTTFNDDHPPTNLISSDHTIRSKGYLADYYIKPPVTLKFTFRHPVHVKQVRLHAKVGEQSSHLFEFWATDSNGEKVKIGRSSGVCDSSDEYVFQNYFFPGNKFHKDRDSGNFRLAPSSALTDVQLLEVRILRANRSGIPCLKKISIFGIPSKCVPQDERLKSRNQWMSICRITEQNSHLPNPVCPSDIVIVNGDTAQVSHENEIPTEFLDALTHTRMDVPMVLPCGQIIDRNTLDIYTQEEAKWGRSPNDPFTGKLFTSTSRPLFDANLKSRIDAHFLGSQGAQPSGLRKRRLELITPPNQPSFNEPNLIEIQSNASTSGSIANGESLSTTNSVDDAINLVLSGKRRIIGNPDAKKSSGCAKCRSKLNLYQFPCSHLVCRNCIETEIKNDSEVLCRSCSKRWKKRQIVKYHSVEV